MFGFIKLKPIYNAIYNEKRREQGPWGTIPKSIIFEALENEATDYSFTDVSFNIKDINLLEINDLEIVYQLIPSKTIDNIHLAIYENSLASIFPKLLIDRRDYEDEFGGDSNIYLLRLYIFRRFAYFILEWIFR